MTLTSCVLEYSHMRKKDYDNNNYNNKEAKINKLQQQRTPDEDETLKKHHYNWT